MGLLQKKTDKNNIESITKTMRSVFDVNVIMITSVINFDDVMIVYSSFVYVVDQKNPVKIISTWRQYYSFFSHNNNKLLHNYFQWVYMTRNNPFFSINFSLCNLQVMKHKPQHSCYDNQNQTTGIYGFTSQFYSVLNMLKTGHNAVFQL